MRTLDIRGEDLIYLDNCSTTRPRDSVIEKMTETLKVNFGNPSSLHRMGMDSENILKNARGIISEYLGVRPETVFFTSGGTESNNLAIQGAIKAREYRGKHIITTRLEHPAVMNTIDQYEKNGYRVSRIKNDPYGRINMEALQNEISEDTVLVAVIHVNNEIGTIQDLEGISKLIQKRSNRPHFHVDGVQSFGKIPFSLAQLGVDSYAFSSHKVHGPKGVGGLYIRDRSKVMPLVFGGNQESGIRSGTENTPGIAGFGEAVRVLSHSGAKETEYVRNLKNHMTSQIQKSIGDLKFNSPPEDLSSPYILNLSFRWTRGEVLLHYLEDEGIYVSTTSACSSKGTQKSHVLDAIDLDREHIEGTIRICFSYENTKIDIDRAVEVLKASVEDVRSVMRR